MGFDLPYVLKCARSFQFLKAVLIPPPQANVSKGIGWKIFWVTIHIVIGDSVHILEPLLNPEAFGPQRAI